MPGRTKQEHVSEQLPKQEHRRLELEKRFGDDKVYVLGDRAFQGGQNIVELQMNGWKKVDLADEDKYELFLADTSEVYAKDKKQHEKEKEQARVLRKGEDMREPKHRSENMIDGTAKKTGTYKTTNDD